MAVKPPADWLSSFFHWAREPSPTGLWVFRGQLARHESMVPSLLRDSVPRVKRSVLGKAKSIQLFSEAF